MSRIAVIGAGIGGLSAALRLTHAGHDVTVFDRASGPGGKMRRVPSAAGPVDAGPTVLTMKPVFDTLFAEVGERLADHVTLTAEPVLARHFWCDGTVLDLSRDAARTEADIADVFGPRSARDFAAFHARTSLLFDAFEGPMMRRAAPSLWNMLAVVAKQPGLLRAMAPHQSLAAHLFGTFSEPRLAQLFSRYATYVGGLPASCPALLGLIWQAESRGVWHVEGGMHALALAIERLARTFGATFVYDCPVTGIETDRGRAVAVRAGGTRHAAEAILFNGDPRALREGLLGRDPDRAVTARAIAPRSLSAMVMSFAAVPQGLPLSAHNALFADDPVREYAPLAQGRVQSDPTLYICAQDRFGGNVPQGPERFEVIQNAPPVDPNLITDMKERQTCRTEILTRLSRFGLTFTPPPGPEALTMPQDFARMFPGSNGALYGRSPHGVMAAFRRPTARTGLPGLYLAGGGAHPGAGLPMATLSAGHAAEAICADLPLTLPCRRGATPGGTSTGSATTARAPSRSSAS